MGVLPCSLERKKNEMDGMIKGAAHFHVAGAYTNLMLWKHCKESISGESFKKWRVCGHDWYSISNPEFGKQFCQSHIQLPVTNNLPLTENGDMITSLSFGFEITWNVDTNRDRTWGACLDSEGSCGYDTLKPTTFLCYCSDGSSNLDRCPGNITGTFPDRLLPSFIANPNA